MKVCIVGAGASGIFLSLRIKETHPEYDVFCLEKNSKIGKKILATGNGKCNLGNSSKINEHLYRNYHQITDVLSKYDFAYMYDYLESLGIKLKMAGSLCYPYSESALSVVENLKKIAIDYEVNFFLETTLIDYQKNDNGLYEIMTNKGSLMANVIVFACGGKAAPQLGTNGEIFPLLNKHQYRIAKLFPGLCPIKTKEITKPVSGLRVKAKVVLREGDKEVYAEEGEVLFKDDGLSGIVIFNMSSLIARRNRQVTYQISLNLFPNETIMQLFQEFQINNKGYFCFLDGYFHEKMVNYLLKRCGFPLKNKYDNAEIKKIACLCTDLQFTFESLYDFDSAQVTVGGLDLKMVDQNLQSRTEKGVFFIGEILDVDGLCGGYNLMWAMASALYVADFI